MSRMFGKHIPDEYDPNWPHSDKPEYWHWYMCGREDGYAECKWFESNLADEKLRRENDRLKELLEACSISPEELKANTDEQNKFIEGLIKKYDREIEERQE
jgi:hypothetical protein